MADPDIIEKAYEDVVGKLFVQYFTNLAAGQPKAECLTHFRNGVGVAREARETAIGAL